MKMHNLHGNAKAEIAKAILIRNKVKGLPITYQDVSIN